MVFPLVVELEHSLDFPRAVLLDEAYVTANPSVNETGN